MARADWIAWLKSSVAKHFYDNLNETITLKLDTDDALEGNIAVLSVTPQIEDEASNCAVAHVRVVLFVKTLPHKTRRYYHEEVAGKAMTAFTVNITAKRYNGGDSSVVGCLFRLDPVDTSELKSKEEQVTTLSSLYELRLDGDA